MVNCTPPATSTGSRPPSSRLVAKLAEAIRAPAVGGARGRDAACVSVTDAHRDEQRGRVWLGLLAPAAPCDEDVGENQTCRRDASHRIRIGRLTDRA
jgi:hypothetical protein